MAFSVHTRVFFKQRYLKTEWFKTSKRDYNNRFGFPAPAKSMIRRSAKQLRQIKNVNIPVLKMWFEGASEKHQLAACLHWFIAQLLFDPQDGGDVPSKRWTTFTGLHGVTSQKITIAARTSNPTELSLHYRINTVIM
jgi:hypothetical protein